MKIEEVLREGAQQCNYLLAYPDKTDDLPLLVYLHGAGERGKTLSHIYRHGIPKLLQNGRCPDAIVLCPQCPAGYVWNNVVDVVKQLIDEVVARFSVKPDRILLTGSSMGGFGTWEMGLTYRNFFAAIAPVAGGGMSWRASALRTTPVLAYHGAIDTVVPAACSIQMTDALRRGGGQADLVLIEGKGHNDGIDFAYAETDLIERLLPYRRTDFTYIPDVCEEWF